MSKSTFILVKHDAALPAATHAEAVASYAKMVLGDYHASLDPDLAVCDWFLTVRVKPRVPPFATVVDKVKTAAAAVGLMSKKSVLDPALEVQLADAIRLGAWHLGAVWPGGARRTGRNRRRRRTAATTAKSPSSCTCCAPFQFSPQPMADIYGFLGAGHRRCGRNGRAKAADAADRPRRRRQPGEHRPMRLCSGF